MVYIREDAVEPQNNDSFTFGTAAKMGASSLVGAACGAIPVAGALTNLLAGTTGSETTTRDMIAGGGAILNLAASVAWGVTGEPLYMAAPAVAGAISWGMRAVEEG